MASDILQDSSSKFSLYRKGEFEMKSRVPFDFFPGTPSIMSKIPLNISTAAGLRQNLLTNSESLNMMLSNKRLP